MSARGVGDTWALTRRMGLLVSGLLWVFAATGFQVIVVPEQVGGLLTLVSGSVMLPYPFS